MFTGSGGGIIPVRAMMDRLTTRATPRAVYQAKLLDGLYGQARAFLQAFFETTAGYIVGLHREP